MRCWMLDEGPVAGRCGVACESRDHWRGGGHEYSRAGARDTLIGVGSSEPAGALHGWGVDEFGAYPHGFPVAEPRCMTALLYHQGLDYGVVNRNDGRVPASSWAQRAGVPTAAPSPTPTGEPYETILGPPPGEGSSPRRLFAANRLGPFTSPPREASRRPTAGIERLRRAAPSMPAVDCPIMPGEVDLMRDR